MAAAAQEMVLSQPKSYWTRTDPDKVVQLAFPKSVQDTDPKNVEISYRDFFEMLSEPDPHNHIKMGTCYMCGPCHGNKVKEHVAKLNICLLDADSSYDEHGEVTSGAPDPVKVHEVLKGHDISHMLYTTYSHGTKGNRYRIVFPFESTEELELRAAVTCLAELIQETGLRLALSQESYRWAQSWQFPRIKETYAPFYSVSHFGHELIGPEIIKKYNFDNELHERLPPQEFHNTDVDEFSLWGQIEKYLSVPKQLTDEGYEFHSQGHQRLGSGELTLVQRWYKPNADYQEGPGVVVFKIGSKHFVYSHYSNDPLATGEAHDAIGCYVQLRGMQTTSREFVTQRMLGDIQEMVKQELEETHPKVMVGGSEFKFANVYDEASGGKTYKYLSKEAFGSLMENKPPVWILDTKGENDNPVMKPIPKAKFWAAARNTKTYNGTEYQPQPLGMIPEREIWRDGQIYFNLFKGWGLEPKPGTWPFLEWHLKYAVCGGYENEYEYLLDWFAHLVQKPQEKPGVALVLQGGKGWGKSNVLSRMIRCFGPNTMVLSTAKQLSGDFNGHLHNKLAVIVEESYWSGDHKAEGPLKTLITDKEMSFEIKKETPFAGISYVRVMMITNNEWAVPVSNDERRYFIPTMSDAALVANRSTIENPRGDFFPKLFEEMDLGGVQAFYNDMLKRDIRGKNIFNAPITAKLSEQLTQTFTKEAAWLYDMLSKGSMRVRDSYVNIGGGGAIVRMDDVEESVAEYLSHYERQRSTFNRIYKFFEKNLPTSHQILNTPGGTYVNFGTIDECRQDFMNQSKMSFTWPRYDGTFQVPQ